MLSVVIPAYNEEAVIPITIGRIHGILEEAKIPHEMIFVDDGSKDATWDLIQAASGEKPYVRGVSFSRNFGKESAIYAGLAECRGECAVVIDCDLQHPPEKIVEMYRLWEQGFQIVEGVKESRGEESKLYSAAAGCFYDIISRAVGIDMTHASDFKLLDRAAVTVLLNMKERNAFFRALSSWIGFTTAQVSFDVQERAAGKSKWSKGALVRYALTNITAFTSVPMQVITVLGGVMLLLTLLQGFEALYRYFTGNAVEGFTTVILLQLFTGSITMLSLGVLGYYVSKIYDEVRERPRYIISKRAGDK